MANKSQSNRNSLKRFFTALIAIVLLFAVAGGGIIWWRDVRSDPVNTFYGTINNNLRTHSFKRKVSQDSLGQSLKQTSEITLAPSHTTHGFTEIEQPGQGANVTTETIASPTEEFVRYTEINAPEESGGDFSKILDVWSRTQPSGGQGSLGDLYGDAVLGVVPYADLSAEDRVPLMEFIRKNQVYKFDSKKVKRSIQDGRPVYAYEVTIAPEAYIGMLKQFAGILGLTQFDDVKPEDYKDTQSATINLVVDVWSRQVKAVEYEGGGRTESVGAFGVYNRPEAPKDYISIQELQQRLQKIQQQ